MGNYLDFGLKIAHRGNTGSHRGKRKLIDGINIYQAEEGAQLFAKILGVQA